MADPIDLITANPDTNNPTDFAAQADLAWTQLKAAIPQINSVATAMNLNDVSDISASTNTLGTGSKNFTISTGKSFLPGQILNIADTNNPATNILTGVVTDYSGSALVVNVLQFLGTSGASVSSWTISLSAMPAIPAVTSELKLTTVTGLGSTNTQIYVFSTVAANTATADLSYDNSATLGTSITAITKGWYRVRHQSIGASPAPGITKNCTQLSTVVSSLSDINQLVARAVSLAASTSGYIDTIIYLDVNDVIRLQGGGGTITTGNANSYLHVQKLSLQGTGGGGGGGGGGGAPTDAQYVVAVRNDNLTNERLAVNSNSINVETGVAGDISFKRNAIVGAITIPADDNISSLSADVVADTNLANMPLRTVKGNPTGSTADPQNMTISGGLSMVTGTPGVIKSKGSFAFPCTFSTSIAMSDPGSDGVRFNSATIASITEVSVSSTLGGRSVGTLLNTFTGAQIGFMSNNSASTAFVIFNVTATDNNGTGDFYTFTVTPLSGLGVLPANTEELQLFYWPSGGAGLSQQDVLNMLVLRRNAQYQIIDEVGNVISGSPRVADYPAMMALDAAAYDGFAVNAQSGLNNAFFASNGQSFSPLNGEYIQEKSNVSVRKIIEANTGITWTAANNGGTVQLTASAAHGLTTGNAVGASMFQSGSATGWTASTFHKISAIPDTTHINLTTAWTAGMGIPVFALAGTEIILKVITLPVLRATSEVEVPCFVSYGTNAVSRKVSFYLNSTKLYERNQTSTNAGEPYLFGFRNLGVTNSQEANAGDNSNGYVVQSGALTTAAYETGSGTNTISIGVTPGTSTPTNVPDIPMELRYYRVIIRG